MSSFKEKLVNIKAFAFDVDGVLSKELVVHPNGDLMRTMNAKDGYALQYAMKKGYKLAIITGGTDALVKDRFSKLGTTDIYMGSHNKIEDFKDYYYKYDLAPEEVLYMGDDIPDLEVIQAAGLGTCPSDAAVDVKLVADYISDRKGGEGCVRDVIEQVLRVRGHWLGSGALEW